MIADDCVEEGGIITRYFLFLNMNNLSHFRQNYPKTIFEYEFLAITQKYLAIIFEYDYLAIFAGTTQISYSLIM